MTDINYAHLRELAEAATPGPWVADPSSAWDTDDFGGYQMQAAVRVKDSGSITWDDHGGEVFKPDDATYIAAVDPQTVLALLDEIERLRGRAFPDPKDGCACTPHWQDAGGGYTEFVPEYEPACPEHSYHLYDPRTDEWVLRSENDWEYGTAIPEAIQDDAQPDYSREDAEHHIARCDVGCVLIRRRVAGPWERVPEGED